jgi:hypothetical protein
VVRNLSVEERVLVLEFAEFLHHGRKERRGGAGGQQTKPASTSATSTK